MNNPAVLDRTQLESMLTTCYELEGLIALAIERDDTTPARVWDMIRLKAASLARRGAAADAAAEPAAEAPADAEAAVEEEVAEAVEEAVEEPQQVAAAVEYEETEDAENSLSEPEKEPEKEPETKPETKSDPQPEKQPAGRIALTIGDKFRFTRELFDGSEADLKEAIAALNAMSSRDEIDDYLYNDLCFDEMNPTVKEFEQLVTQKL